MQILSPYIWCIENQYVRLIGLKREQVLKGKETFEKLIKCIYNATKGH